MKVLVSKASEPWGEGQIEEYEDLQDCIDTLLETADFGRFSPSVIVRNADGITEYKSGGACKYEVTIYDTWIE